MRKCIFPSAILMALAAFTSNANADTLVSQLQTVSPYQFIPITLDGMYDNVTAYTGQINWLRTGGTFAGSPSIGDTFPTFCIELTQDVWFGGTYTYNVVPVQSAPNPGGWGVGPNGMGDAKAELLSQLWGQHFTDIGNDNTAGAAFQLAIWEIVYDDGILLDSGAFRVPNLPASTLAQSWLNTLNPNGRRASLLAISSPNHDDVEGVQDQLFFQNWIEPHGPGISSVVPLPSSAYTGLALLGGCGLFAWRKRTRLA